MTLTELFTNIANAIRVKKNVTYTIIASDFPSEIATITTGGDESNFITTDCYDLLLNGNYGYFPAQVCDQLLNGTYQIEEGE